MKVMKENNKNTEAAILEAADKLFKEKGFKGATTTMIAGQAGVTHAMYTIIFARKSRSMSPRSLQCRGGRKSSHTPIRYAISLTQCVPSI